MNQTYPLFYRQYGVRRLQQLVSPTLFDITELSLPKNSILHSLTDTEGSVGFDETLPYLNYNRKIITQDFIELLADEGKPRFVSSVVSGLNREFYFKHRLFRRSQNPIKDANDINSLVIINYDSLKHTYRYPNIKLQPYYAWRNEVATLWKNIENISGETNREHFVFVNIPNHIPSPTVLNFFSKNITPSVFKYFTTTKEFFILELWKWCRLDQRANSVIGNTMTEDKLSRVNIIFTIESKWVCVNLGLLNTFIKNASQEPANIVFDGIVIQKLMLKFMMSAKNMLIDQNTTEVLEPTTPTPSIDEDVDEGDETNVEVKTDTVDYVSGIKQKTPELNSSLTLNKIDDKSATANLSDDDSLTESINSLDEDIKILDKPEDSMIHHAKIKDDGEIDLEQEHSFTTTEEELTHIRETLYTSNDDYTELNNAIDEFASYSLMPASDYKRNIKLATQYNESENPYKSNAPIKEFIKIKPEDTILSKEKSTLEDIPTVIDKTMLESSLLEFDKHYITNILKRDVVSMVSSVRRMGVNVLDYEVTPVESILGAYEIHSIKVKPVDGAASVLKFKLPVVEEEGYFFAGGKKYHMRKQQYDAPIRKINPFTVALSSYYGKVFIRRSQKKVNDLYSWIADKILAESVSTEFTNFSAVSPGSVYDNQVNAPRVYTSLSMYLISFKVSGLYFNFNYNKRHEIISDESSLKLYETDGSVVVGVSKDNRILLVDKNNIFHYATLRAGVVKTEVIGDIIAVTGFDIKKAPMDFSELAIYSKSVPLGIVMSYYLGFTNYVKLLGVAVKVIPSNTRVALSSNEWAIKFKDKRVIFNRDDNVAMLALSGFLDYDKIIKDYFMEAFDNKNVYLNILESRGVTGRYIKELDIMDKMFVDNATRLVLSNMKEPTTFKGLLARANELLVTDIHPLSQDPAHMRVRGYERFSGVVYKEIVTALKEFSYKNVRGRAQINLNPFVIWNTLVQDPAVEIVKDINPIQNLKEQESLTYTGEGGRSKDTMNKESREYHPNNMGLISEATSDSSDVGINTYLSANPNLSDSLGTYSKTNIKEKGMSSLLSTSAMLAPAALHDENKRI